MIWLLVGHRGTGKSSLLPRLARVRPDRPCYDLDREIEIATGDSISQLFKDRGEAAFRDLERATLGALLERGDSAVIALGAGFEGLESMTLPPASTTVWIRRESDREGRIFLDRPRLRPQLKALDEFQSLATERTARYARLADEVLTLPEGEDGIDVLVDSFFDAGFTRLGGVLCLDPARARRPGLAEFLARRIAWGVECVELRTDLLDERTITEALRALPAERALVSYRRGPGDGVRPPPGVACDWDIALGPVPENLSPHIVSSHRREPGESLAAAIARLDAAAPSTGRLKLAVPTRDLAELEAGHSWAAADSRRSFLPISERGDFGWYRLARRGSSEISFWREGWGGPAELADQPLLHAWATAPAAPRALAAVVGDPVAHSQTPEFHSRFFAERGLQVSTLRLPEGALTEVGMLARLRRFGFRALAVTAPLKLDAFAVADTRTEVAQRLKSVNTLVWSEDRWRATNTDLDGARVWLEGRAGPDTAVAVWGGGGTLAVLHELVPQAKFYSARSGQVRAGESESESEGCDLLIWASGDFDAARMPGEWAPRAVFDLSYRENSPGRLAALHYGAEYVSGLEMFRAQARAQQRFWHEFLGGVAAGPRV